MGAAKPTKVKNAKWFAKGHIHIRAEQLGAVVMWYFPEFLWVAVSLRVKRGDYAISLLTTAIYGSNIKTHLDCAEDSFPYGVFQDKPRCF